MNLIAGDVVGTTRLVLNAVINRRRARNDLDIAGILPAEGARRAAVDDDSGIYARATSVASREYCAQLMASPDSWFLTLFRMTKAVFLDLCQWLNTNTNARGNRQQSLEQKVMVFLWICAYGEPQRNAALRFRTSQATVSRVFHELKDPMRQLHNNFVRQPESTYLSPVIELNAKFIAFNGAIGAIDGTLIPAYIPTARQQRFWSRKNNIAQNVFAAVTFDGLFCYVLAGAEGSINDSTLLRHVLTLSFSIPEGRYYLGDAGFGLQRGVMTPYNHNTRYHLQDWGTAAQRPQNKEELYNLRHAQKRTIVEHVFGRCKRKWKIIRHSAAEYKFLDQIRIVYAVTGLDRL